MALFIDGKLARRLERTEGAVGSSFIAVRQRLSPGTRAVWKELAGTYLIFDGVGSPFTQTFGLGLMGPVTPRALAEIEAFFTERGAQTMHEVSPLAGVELLRDLVARGYQPVELSTVLVQELEPPPSSPPPTELRVRPYEDRDRDAWIEASVQGWSEEPGHAGVIRSIAESAIENRAMASFVVERGDEMIATASLGIHEGVALLAGASTVPSGRGLGAQGLLLSVRLEEARRRGCDAAMMVTTPGSTSQRNAERRGFSVAYTRTKWQLPLPPA